KKEQGTGTRKIKLGVNSPFRGKGEFALTRSHHAALGGLDSKKTLAWASVFLESKHHSLF
ncbi:MAG: hypothetical protein LBJ18_03415, partial [Rickettsiales bacterium]|nr:hypothetical protein [Rickettsiales bacterium]